MESLRERTVSGLGWNAATQAVAKALQFAVLILLAHLLGPGDFGLIGMVLVFTGFASSIADLGMGTSIVQAQKLSDESLDGTFWLAVALGSILTLIFMLIAPLVSAFYGQQQLRVLTVVLALNFVLESVTVVQFALLQKSLDFRSRFWIEVTAISISGAIAVTLALSGAGVWSLVAQRLSGSAIRTVSVWYRSSWRPHIRFDIASIRDLFRFGRHLTGFNIVVYCAQHFDKLAIGRQGNSALGLYNLSDRLMRLPLVNVTTIAGAVMFPALSELQNNTEKAKRAYLRANRMIALLTFPMVLGLCALAEPAILVIYGPKWRMAINIVQVLCLAGLAQSVYNTSSWIFLSYGRPDILFRLGTLSLVVRVVGVLIGMQWGLLGVAWAYVLGSYLCLMYPTWSAAGKLIGLRFVELLRNVAGPFCLAVCMAATIWISDQWFFVQKPNWLRLVMHTFAGIAIYGVLISSFKLQAWEEARELALTVGQQSRLIRFLLENNSQVNTE